MDRKELLDIIKRLVDEVESTGGDVYDVVSAVDSCYVEQFFSCAVCKNGHDMMLKAHKTRDGVTFTWYYDYKPLSFRDKLTVWWYWTKSIFVTGSGEDDVFVDRCDLLRLKEFLHQRTK